MSEKTESRESAGNTAGPLAPDRVGGFREAAEEFLMIKGPVSLVAPKPVKAKKDPEPSPEIEEEKADTPDEPRAAEAKSEPAASVEADDPSAPTSIEAASAAVKAMAEGLQGTEDSAPEKESVQDDIPAQAPEPAAAIVRAESDGSVDTGLIREMVEEDHTSSDDPEPVMPIPVDEIPDSPVVLAEQDRWSELRTPLVDEGVILDDPDQYDDYDDEEYFPAEEQPRAQTPIERVRARESAAILNSAIPPLHATPVVASAPAMMHAEPTFDGPDSTLSKTSRTPPPKPSPKPMKATPKPEVINDREWDMPSDHEMSGKGKLLWRMGVYGSLLAGPLYLILTSTFPPQEAAKHYASAAGCIVADYLGVSGAQPGQPGYFAHLDYNKNGIACEAMARASEKRKVTFIRPGDY